MSALDFTRFHSRLRLSGRLRLETSLRVGSGGGGDAGGTADITVVKDVTGAPYIPGSSFKGALRAHLEGVLRAINQEYACLCVTIRKGATDGCPTTRDPQKEWPDLEPLKKAIEQSRADSSDLDDFYFSKSCKVCRVFGSPHLASKVFVRDLALPDGEEWLGRYQIRDGVAIDRDTETASEGKLYSFEAVPAGTEFACEIIVENASVAEQGMVLLGLKGFEAGRVPLGGARSRGLGRVHLEWEQCEEVDGGDPTALLDYLMTGQAQPLDAAGLDRKIEAFRRELGV